MQSITTVTQKGQVTIPKYFREYLNIEPYDKVVITKASGYLKIFPVGPSIFDLAGTFHIPKNKPSSGAREAMGKSFSRF